MNFQFELAGISHRHKDYARANVQRGDVLKLQCEPTNKFDPDAIMVFKGDIQIGYVPRTHTLPIKAAVLSERATCLADAVWPRGCWVSVNIKPKETNEPTEDRAVA